MKSSATLLSEMFNLLIKLLCRDGARWRREQIGGGYDKGRMRPFVIFGEGQVRLWRSVTFDGDHHRFEIEVYGDRDMDGLGIRDRAQDIIDTIHGADLTLNGHVLIDLQFEKAFYKKLADQSGYLARLIFTAVTITD